MIEQLFGIYPNTIEWRLDTIKQETGNCHLYEKYGFVYIDTLKSDAGTMETILMYDVAGE